MIKHYPYESLGHTDLGWLSAKHHFSFGGYHDSTRLNFGTLRVINDDIIQANKGFTMHPHANMEIITYVRTGAITHKDNQGNEGETKAGDVQVMSAGSGIYHSEFNLETQDTSLYQIWIEPNKMNINPRWDSHAFPKSKSLSQLSLLVSGDGSAPLQIQQDAFIYAGNLPREQKIQQSIKHQAYVLVSEGEITIDQTRLGKGDGTEISGVQEFNIEALSEAQVLVIDVPNR